MNFHSPKGLVELIKIKRLYKRAFPKEERKPFSVIRKMQKLGKSDIWYFEQDGVFLGLSTTINGADTVLIDYFAVDESRRGQGNGSRMLDALIEYYSPKGVFLEIEIPYEDSENYLQRLRRKSFYLSRGLVEMGTVAELFGVDMELLGKGVHLDFDGYRNFYLENYGRFAYDHIKEIVNKE